MRREKKSVWTSGAPEPCLGLVGPASNRPEPRTAPRRRSCTDTHTSLRASPSPPPSPPQLLPNTVVRELRLERSFCHFHARGCSLTRLDRPPPSRIPLHSRRGKPSRPTAALPHARTSTSSRRVARTRPRRAPTTTASSIGLAGSLVTRTHDELLHSQIRDELLHTRQIQWGLPPSLLLARGPLLGTDGRARELRRRLCPCHGAAARRPCLAMVEAHS